LRVILTCLTLSFTDTMARTTTTVRPPWKEIEKTLKKAKKNKKKATLEYILKELPDEDEADVRRGLNTGVHFHEYYQLKDGGYEMKPEVKQEPKAKKAKKDKWLSIWSIATKNVLQTYDDKPT